LFIAAASANTIPTYPSHKSTIWNNFTGAAKEQKKSLSGAGTQTLLDKEAIEIFLEFCNNPAYEDCFIEESYWSQDEIMLRVICGQKEVFRGLISLNGQASYLFDMKSPDGEGTGADIVKLFEAMAKSQSSSSINVRDDSAMILFKEGVQIEESNPMIRSTVLMTFLSGKFSGYYQALGYHCEDLIGDDDLIDGADKLLDLHVGEWCIKYGANRLREYDPEKKFHVLFQKLHKQASGADGKAVEQDSKELLLEIAKVLQDKDLSETIRSIKLVKGF
jgi:hypothetical protein